MSRCRSCGAAIVWARTATRRPMPIDPDPVPHGNVKYLRPGIVAVIDRSSIFDQHAEGPWYVSHFSTCPAADTWRGSRARGGAR